MKSNYTDIYAVVNFGKGYSSSDYFIVILNLIQDLGRFQQILDPDFHQDDIIKKVNLNPSP